MCCIQLRDSAQAHAWPQGIVLIGTINSTEQKNQSMVNKDIRLQNQQRLCKLDEKKFLTRH